MARVSPLLLLLGWAVAQPERRPTLGASSADHRPPPHTLAHEGDFDAIASEIRSDLKEIEASTAAATHGPSASHNAPHAGTLVPLDVDAIDNDPDHVLHDLRKLALELEALAPDERPSLEELERERSAMMSLKKVLMLTRGAMKRAGADKDIDLAFSGNVKIAVGGGFEIGSIGAGIYIEINVEAGGTGTVAATASMGGGGEGLKKLLKDALRKALGKPSRVMAGVSTEDQAFFTEPLTFVGPVNPLYEQVAPEASDVVRSRTCTAESTDVFNEFGPAEEEEGDGDPENTEAVEFPHVSDLAEQYGTVSTSAGVGAEVQAKLLARVSVSLVGGFANYFCDFHTAVTVAADTPLMNRLNELGLNPALNLDPRWAALLNGFEGTWNNFKADACQGASMYFFVRRLPGAAIFLRGRNFSWKCVKALGLWMYNFKKGGGSQAQTEDEKRTAVDEDKTKEPPMSGGLGWEFTIYAHAGIPGPLGFGASVGGYYEAQKELEWSPRTGSAFSRLRNYFKLRQKKDPPPKDLSDDVKAAESHRESIISPADMVQISEEDTSPDTSEEDTSPGENLAEAVAATGASSDTTTTG